MIVLCQAFAASDPLVRHAVIGTAEHNALWFAGPGRGTPPFPSWGVRYRPDEPGGVVFVPDAPTLRELGEGSCQSLACAMYGWLRAQGDEATMILRRLATGRWHGIVRRGDGTIWDPQREVQHAA